MGNVLDVLRAELINRNGKIQFFLANYTKAEVLKSGHPDEWMWVWHQPDGPMKIRARSFEQIMHGYFGFYVHRSERSFLLLVPHWSLVLPTVTLAILLKPKPGLKISLRELLLLTTIAAVVFGTIAALPKLANF